MDADARRRNLEELLSQRLEVGRDAEGELKTQAVIKDLTGRADSQGRWRNARVEDMGNAIAPLLAGWQGLRSTDEGLTGLAILHNPDQVAGGEREIPEDVDDLTPYIGPGIVNSALGATWGLPEEGGDGTTTMQQLTARVQDLYPEAAWPLYTTNFLLQVEVRKGSRVVPGSGGPRKPSRKRRSMDERKDPPLPKKQKKSGKKAKAELLPGQRTLADLLGKK